MINIIPFLDFIIILLREAWEKYSESSLTADGCKNSQDHLIIQYKTIRSDIKIRNRLTRILFAWILFLIEEEHEFILILQITKEDGLPKNICQRCIYKLDMFYEFRISCMTTDSILKSYADSLKHLAASVNNQVSNIFSCA